MQPRILMAPRLPGADAPLETGSKSVHSIGLHSFRPTFHSCPTILNYHPLLRLAVVCAALAYASKKKKCAFWACQKLRGSEPFCASTLPIPCSLPHHVEVPGSDSVGAYISVVLRFNSQLHEYLFAFQVKKCLRNHNAPPTSMYLLFRAKMLNAFHFSTIKKFFFLLKFFKIPRHDDVNFSTR